MIANTKELENQFKFLKGNIMKEEKKEEQYGDIIYNHDLKKHTIMVAGFPAMITSYVAGGKTLYKGFLPGFEFAQVEEMEDEETCVEFLQDMLDDEVEELVVFGKSLPNVAEDDELTRQYPDYKIVYLDINVYATEDDENYYDCTHDCSCCHGHCHDDDCDDEDCGCDD